MEQKRADRTDRFPIGKAVFVFGGCIALSGVAYALFGILSRCLPDIIGDNEIAIRLFPLALGPAAVGALLFATLKLPMPYRKHGMVFLAANVICWYGAETVLQIQAQWEAEMRLKGDVKEREIIEIIQRMKK